MALNMYLLSSMDDVFYDSDISNDTVSYVKVLKNQPFSFKKIL